MNNRHDSESKTVISGVEMQHYGFNDDCKIYYCNKLKRHYWLLGYFGGGSIQFGRFKKVAEDFAKVHNCNVEEVQIDEILHSRRLSGFKYLFCPTTDGQEPISGIHCEIDDAWDLLTD